MMYRAKCTGCISQVMNTYDLHRHPILRDKRDFYIDVFTEREAELIEELSDVSERATQIYMALLHMFIDVNSRKEANLIARLNGLQEESYKVYQELINLK